jgi:hypothetical protein
MVDVPGAINQMRGKTEKVAEGRRTTGISKRCRTDFERKKCGNEAKEMMARTRQESNRGTAGIIWDGSISNHYGQ